MNPSLLRMRRGVQVAVLVFFALLPWLNRWGLHGASGNLFALNIFGIPFADPLATLQVAVGGTQPATHLLLGGALVLALAAMLGRVFCSWGCPFGLLSEVVHACAPRNNKPLPARRPVLWRLCSMVLGLLFVVLAGIPLLNQLSLPGELSLQCMELAQRVPAPSASLLVIAAILAMEWRTGQRLWCRYVCPQSVLLSVVAGRLPGGLRLTRNMRHCTCKPNDRACAGTCPLDLAPRNPLSATPMECTNCGKCVTACSARGGALSLTFGHWRTTSNHTPCSTSSATKNTADSSANEASR